ncbi:hypothetical protein GC177_07505 [bacterium]|nr:hypothetical protein [bacterium]
MEGKNEPSSWYILPFGLSAFFIIDYANKAYGWGLSEEYLPGFVGIGSACLWAGIKFHIKNKD